MVARSPRLPTNGVPPMRSATFLVRSGWMSATTTRAPSAASRSARARPMPWPPPVTTAHLSWNCILFLPLARGRMALAHQVVAEVADVLDAVLTGAAVVVARHRVTVGEEGERGARLWIHERQLARSATVTERPR